MQATQGLRALLNNVYRPLPPIYKCKVCNSYVEEKVHCSLKARLVLDPKTRVRLSKLLTAVLRHVPNSVGLALSCDGWVSMSKLVTSIRSHKPGYEWLSEEHVRAIAMLDPKGRFELKDDLIRARYGHSKELCVEVDYQEDGEVKRLFHGTSALNLDSILREGIKPMKRTMVHLATSIQDAVEVALRKDRSVVVFEVDADELRQRGINVYKASERVYVVAYVPPAAIRGYQVYAF